jgi:uncharacterized RDD family membrane protein YckC
MTAQIETSALPPAQRARVRPRVQVHKTRAPFSLRCGALLIDYILLMAVVAISTLVARMLGGGARTAGSSTETVGLLIVFLLAILNFGVFPGWRGQSIGKWATGLRIERTGGQTLSIGRSFLRHFVGYPLSLLTLGIGFLVAAVNGRGRTLQDLIADTIVVRDEVVLLDGNG